VGATYKVEDPALGFGAEAEPFEREPGLNTQPIPHSSAVSLPITARLNPRTTLVCNTSITEPMFWESAEANTQHIDA
jgi:hypothetical protein